MSIFSKLKFWNSKPFYGLGNYFLFNNTPTWIDLDNTKSLFETFFRNPVLYSVIMILANESANMKFVVQDRLTGEDEPEGTNNKEAKKIYKLLNYPNPLQSRWEFLQQNIIFHKLAGNSFIYANAPTGFKINIETINTLVNVWPQYMKAKTTGKSFFSATEITDIIEKWVFDPDAANIPFDPKEILHRNNPNVNPKDLVLGQSTATSLTMPLSNIEMAYEARNVMMKNRGMRGVFTSNSKDGMGASLPMDPKDEKSVHESFKRYGLLENQMPFFFSPYPIDFTPVDQDVRKLGLFEEIESSAIEVCHAYGVPEILLKKSLEGTTYENQESSIRRLYQGTIIPQMDDFCTALNRFLGLDDTRWKIKGTFDHIPALQKSEKEKADSNKSTSEYMNKLFLVGGCTLNTWLDQLELPKLTQPYGDQTIFEMKPEDREIILSMIGKATSQPETIKSLNGKIKELVN